MMNPYKYKKIINKNSNLINYKKIIRLIIYIISL